MPTLIITRGLPGSGKSTWANTYADNGHGIVVERDMIRKELFNSWWTGKHEDEQKVTKLQHKRVKGLLALGYNVIVSDTNLRDKDVRVWLEIAHNAGAETHIVDYRDEPLETVLERNASDTRKYLRKVVPEEVIREKYERFIKGRDLSVPVEWKPSANEIIYPYEQGNGYPAIIVDIDGTVADMDGQRSPYDYSKVHLDKPKQDVIDILDASFVDGANVYFVSGRKSECREATEAWLREHIPFPYEELYMRADGDDREDSIIKYELFNAHIRPLGHRIIGVFDDRHRVLRMWRKLGLTTFHVNGPDAGDF